MDILQEIIAAKQQPLTPENLNYIGDLYLKIGDKQTAILHFYEAAEKLHSSQKDKKLAIYKKILNISTSESMAYEKIINIFSRTGLVADERKYLLTLANLYQNKGEHNKLDALFRRIKEIDSNSQALGRFSERSGKYKGTTSKIPRKTSLVETDVSSQKIPEDVSAAIEDTKVIAHNGVETQRNNDTNSVQERTDGAAHIVTSWFTENSKKPSLYVVISFLLILLGVSLYLYRNNFERSAIFFKIKDTTVQTANYEITIGELTGSNELTGKVEDKDRNNNFFYALSIKAKKSCLDDSLVSNLKKMMFFIDTQGNQVKMNDVKGLDSLTKTIYRTNICGKDAGAVFMRIIFSHEKKARYTGIYIAGLEKGGPVLIKWN
jgi:tetratricopeptide (TPR) repeat protein